MLVEQQDLQDLLVLQDQLVLLVLEQAVHLVHLEQQELQVLLAPVAPLDLQESLGHLAHQVQLDLQV